VVIFDASGLGAMLAEWYATDSARRSVSTLLEPLERLGGKRAEAAIRTLQVYLDEQGSVTRTARRLHLHRNAVAYRIGRIKDALPVDVEDPDTRLALQLACRARLLA
jgi:DNA-binding PucR family transcriptional regulator